MSNLVLMKVLGRDGMPKVYDVLPPHVSSPELVERYGRLLFSKADSGWIRNEKAIADDIHIDTKLINALEAMSFDF